MYHQTLKARKPINLAKVNLVRQEPEESSAAFLERLTETFRQYTPMDPQADESCTAIMLAFVNQAAPDYQEETAENREVRGTIHTRPGEGSREGF